MRLRAVLPSLAAFVVASLFGMLPFRAASAFGGWIGRTFGPLTRRHRIAAYNLEKALPELSEQESARVLSRMWENFGRTTGEYPHLDAFVALAARHDDSITFQGLEGLEALLREHPGVIFIGGHFGNWELGPLISRRLDAEYIVVYHALHEPYIDRLVRKCRSKISKNLVDNKSGLKAMVGALQAGSSVCLLVDQKPRYGPLVPFFGRGVKTTTAPAKLALRYGVPIVPVQVARGEGTEMKITVHPPLEMAGIGDDDAGVAEITASINQLLEAWVREDPSQWHWIHRRWPDSIR